MARGAKLLQFLSEVACRGFSEQLSLSLFSGAVKIGLGVSIFSVLTTEPGHRPEKEPEKTSRCDSLGAVPSQNQYFSPPLDPPLILNKQTKKVSFFWRALRCSLVLDSGKIQQLKCSAFKKTLSGK